MSVKMIKCKACGHDIACNAKTCPNCGAKNKKPFYKKWWVWAIVIIICIIGIANSGSKDNSTGTSTTTEVQTSSEATSQSGETSITDSTSQADESNKIPTEYKSALNKAKTYSESMHMSKQGIYNQLTSEYGEKFSAEAAQYAIDNLQADYNKNALEKAKSYQKMDMSPSAIHDQLISEYGEQFTEEEANYAIAHLE